jgi:HSP20 family molecular chaperone IbpA
MANIERSIEVGVPVRTAYNQWTQFEEFPRFMQSVREVRQIDDTHLHWSVDVGGKPMEWDAEIVEQVPDQRIAWRGTNGNKATGGVRFEPLGDSRCRITLTMDYGGTAGKNVKDQELAERTEQDLQRFAQYIEQRGQESGAWRGEVHGAQTAGNGSQRAGGNGQGDSQQRESRGAPDEQQRSGEQRRERSVQGASRMFEEAERFANRMAGQSLSAFSQPMAFGPRPMFSSLFSTFDTPLQMMRRLSEEMDREVESFMWGAPGTTRRALAAQAAPSWSPSIDVSREGQELVICADLPGVKKEEVSVEVADGHLVISGERRVERSHTDESSGERRIERVCGRFERAIALPEGARPEDAQATMNDGVLEIRMPANERKQRRLEIRSSGQQSQSSSGQGMAG